MYEATALHPSEKNRGVLDLIWSRLHPGSLALDTTLCAQETIEVNWNNNNTCIGLLKLDNAAKIDGIFFRE